MSTMHRQMISLTKPQADYLKAEADRLGISVSDLIRRIIDNYLSGCRLVQWMERRNCSRSVRSKDASGRM